MRTIVSILAVASARLANGARIAPDNLVLRPFGTGSAISFKGARAGELAGIFVFGFVVSSNIVEGRSYHTAQGQTRVLKEFEIIPIAQEGERLLATLSMICGGKVLTLPVTEAGGLTFSTKHTVVDEDGNAEKKSTSHILLFSQHMVLNAMARNRHWSRLELSYKIPS